LSTVRAPADTIKPVPVRSVKASPLNVRVSPVWSVSPPLRVVRPVVVRVELRVVAPVTARVDDRVVAPVTARVPEVVILPVAPATWNRSPLPTVRCQLRS